MELPETLRTFVALDLPETTKQTLIDIQQDLHLRCPGNVMYWPPIQSFHLTLFYLGNTPASLRASIEDALTIVGQQSIPFSLTLGGLGTFLKASYPWVFFVKVDDYTGYLQKLYEAVRDCLSQFNYKDDFPIYHPHITLCKAKSETTPDVLQPFGVIAQDFDIPLLGAVNINEMTFFHSVPNLDTSVYIPLKRIPLLGIG